METLQYKLQQFDPGIVWLDKTNIVTALNSVANQILGGLNELPLGKNIIDFHPVKSQDKVQMLLKESQCPMDSPPPVSMMINAIDRLLMIKVSKMYSESDTVGTCMIFYDLTDIASGVTESPRSANKSLLIKKIPVYKNNRILLIDLEDVVYIKAEGHYSAIHTIDAEYLCNLSLSDLGDTISVDNFKRVHRSFIIDLDRVCEIIKKDKDLLLSVKYKQNLTVPVGRSYQDLIKQHFSLS